MIYIYVLYGGDTVELNRVDSNDEIYTGVLRYKDDDYQFVFSDTKLRLIPCLSLIHI